jgi:hypothetical protein
MIGKAVGDLLVELLLDLELAGPHLLALLVGDVVEAVAVEIALEVVAEHVVEQVAVADAIDRDLDLVGVDGDERNTLLARSSAAHRLCRQDAPTGCGRAHRY